MDTFERSFLPPSLKTVCRLAALSLFGLAYSFAEGPTVSNVTASQRANTKLVDISYDLEHTDDLECTVTVEGTTDGENWTPLHKFQTGGDVGYGVPEGAGKAIVWLAGEEWPTEFFPQVKVRVRANDGTGGGVEPSAFSLVPGGVYTMGSPAGELGRNANNETAHSVTISNTFYVSRTEVSYGEWQETRADAVGIGYSDLPAGTKGSDGNGTDAHPVTEITWHEALKYCNARSELEGKTPVYYTNAEFGVGNIFRTGTPTVYADWSANGYRLPTEGEWEFACRAGTQTGFANGAITVPTGADPNLEAIGWYDQNSGGVAHAVAGKVANNWDLHDMHGNVWEWCWDRYVDDLGAEAAVDPKGPASGAERVIRGGGWADQAQSCRSARRFKFAPNGKHSTLGFRVVVSGN